MARSKRNSNAIGFKGSNRFVARAVGAIDATNSNPNERAVVLYTGGGGGQSSTVAQLERLLYQQGVQLAAERASNKNRVAKTDNKRDNSNISTFKRLQSISRPFDPYGSSIVVSETAVEPKIYSEKILLDPSKGITKDSVESIKRKDWEFPVQSITQIAIPFSKEALHKALLYIQIDISWPEGIRDQSGSLKVLLIEKEVAEKEISGFNDFNKFRAVKDFNFQQMNYKTTTVVRADVPTIAGEKFVQSGGKSIYALFCFKIQKDSEIKLQEFAAIDVQSLIK